MWKTIQKYRHFEGEILKSTSKRWGTAMLLKEPIVLSKHNIQETYITNTIYHTAHSISI